MKHNECEECHDFGTAEDPVVRFLEVIPKGSDKKPSFYVEGVPCVGDFLLHESHAKERDNLVEFNEVVRGEIPFDYNSSKEGYNSPNSKIFSFLGI